MRQRSPLKSLSLNMMARLNEVLRKVPPANATPSLSCTPRKLTPIADIVARVGRESLSD